jgi:hypothetical protein
LTEKCIFLSEGVPSSKLRTGLAERVLPHLCAEMPLDVTPLVKKINFQAHSPSRLKPTTSGLDSTGLSHSLDNFSYEPQLSITSCAMASILSHCGPSEYLSKKSPFVKEFVL